MAFKWKTLISSKLSNIISGPLHYYSQHSSVGFIDLFHHENEMSWHQMIAVLNFIHSCIYS